MSRFTYQGDKAKAISFPLGGIGSGCIGLAGNGRLIDWELFNRPNKQSENSFSHFAVKAEADGELLDARILNGDFQVPYTGNMQARRYHGYGFGPSRSTLAGIPHFKDVTFTGEFPIANVQFEDTHFPGVVKMTAFNPFIPLNDRDSSIPGAFFDIEVSNTSNKAITYTINMALANPFLDEQRVNRYIKTDNAQLIQLSSGGYEDNDPKFGDLTVATDSDDVSFQEYWYRGTWFDNLETYWGNFAKSGKFANRSYDGAATKSTRDPEHADHCSLASHFELLPGETKTYVMYYHGIFPIVTRIGKRNPLDVTTAAVSRLSLLRGKTITLHYLQIQQLAQHIRSSIGRVCIVIR